MKEPSVRQRTAAGVAVGALTAAWLLGLFWLAVAFVVHAIVSEPTDDAPRMPDPVLAQLAYAVAALLVAGPFVVAGGQLGLGVLSYSTTPAQAGNATTWNGVSAGYARLIAEHGRASSAPPGRSRTPRRRVLHRRRQRPPLRRRPHRARHRQPDQRRHPCVRPGRTVPCGTAIG
ncbi:hypothetical protein ACQEVZ_58605 [Dactylosporangium sp. CA-152071]|uniref:hypothetical protein n=1 Tax=Dactylosporangium sp. CA-152071 TaxID=3239933 RepID=UPI003D8E475A